MTENSFSPDEVAFMLAVLEDYSNRLVGWGAIFIAMIFGNFSLLQLFPGENINLPEWILITAVYIVLYLVGIYAVVSFFEYSFEITLITKRIKVIRSDAANYQGIWDFVFSQPINRWMRPIYGSMYRHQVRYKVLAWIVYSFVVWTTYFIRYFTIIIEILPKFT